MKNNIISFDDNLENSLLKKDNLFLDFRLNNKNIKEKKILFFSFKISNLFFLLLLNIIFFICINFQNFINFNNLLLKDYFIYLFLYIYINLILLFYNTFDFRDILKINRKKKYNKKTTIENNIILTLSNIKQNTLIYKKKYRRLKKIKDTEYKKEIVYDIIFILCIFSFVSYCLFLYTPYRASEIGLDQASEKAKRNRSMEKAFIYGDNKSFLKFFSNFFLSFFYFFKKIFEIFVNFFKSDNKDFFSQLKAMYNGFFVNRNEGNFNLFDVLYDKKYLWLNGISFIFILFLNLLGMYLTAINFFIVNIFLFYILRIKIKTLKNILYFFSSCFLFGILTFIKALFGSIGKKTLNNLEILFSVLLCNFIIIFILNLYSLIYNDKFLKERKILFLNSIEDLSIFIRQLNIFYKSKKNFIFINLILGLFPYFLAIIVGILQKPDSGNKFAYNIGFLISSSDRENINYFSIMFFVFLIILEVMYIDKDLLRFTNNRYLYKKIDNLV